MNVRREKTRKKKSLLSKSEQNYETCNKIKKEIGLLACKGRDEQCIVRSAT